MVIDSICLCRLYYLKHNSPSHSSRTNRELIDGVIHMKAADELRNYVKLVRASTDLQFTSLRSFFFTLNLVPLSRSKNTSGLAPI
mmetsp:Transcript_8103/g.13898  ORF Transcript_8103/g.13898 Transcript_8103/m.13898 type:complete len:85 (-) Transcript_8103:307-561(-)